MSVEPCAPPGMTLVSTAIPRANVEVNEQIECTNSTYYLHACLGLFLEGSGGWAWVCGLGEIVLEGQPSLAPSSKCIFIFYIYFGGPLLDPVLDGLFLNTPGNGIIIHIPFEAYSSKPFAHLWQEHTSPDQGNNHNHPSRPLPNGTNSLLPLITGRF
jgi:hypothetical protein